METKYVNLYVFDTTENFQKSKRFLGEEGVTFRRMVCVSSAHEFENQLSLLNDDDFVVLAVHVFYTDKISGIKSFVASQISRKYPGLQIMYISEGNSLTIKHQMVEEAIQPDEIYKYHHVQSNIEDEKIRILTKSEIVNLSKQKIEELNDVTNYSSGYAQIDYAIITALYEDEFEALKNIFSFPEDKEIRTETKTYYRGYLKSNPKIEVVAAIPNATGMVDSSIIATQMLDFFRPKYLLMSGVCGGSKDHCFGDIIVAKQVYTFQKGKVSDLLKTNIHGSKERIDLYDKLNNKIDYSNLFDEEGNKITISIEKFEIEHDAVININSSIEDNLKHKLKAIKAKINDEIDNSSFFEKGKLINIDIQPIACSTMVINREGFFEDTIKSINRKTAAVEMESYGVARACHFANNGRTKPIIFKSVMDHTSYKSDVVSGINYKKFAAYTSSLFMKFLFEEKII